MKTTLHLDAETSFMLKEIKEKTDNTVNFSAEFRKTIRMLYQKHVGSGQDVLQS